MEKYQCSRCDVWVEDKDSDVYHFKSVHKPTTLLSIQMCLRCRDAVFDFIENAPAKQADGEDELKIDPADCMPGFGEGPHYGGLKRRSET